MFGVLFFLVALIVLLIIIHDRVKYRKIYKLLGKLPGPKTIPLIGVAYEFRSTEVIIGSFLKLYYRYGSTFGAWIFRVPIVIISDPKHLKIVLNHENSFDKDKRYRFAHEFFGNALLLAPANVWKKNRKIINPALNQKILDSFMHIFIKHSALMMKELQNDIPENEPFQVDNLVLKYAMDILLESAMGVEDEEMPKPPEFANNLHRISEIIIQRSFKVWLHPDFMFRWSPLGREFKSILNKLMIYFTTFVEKRYTEFHSQKENELSFDDNKRKPFLEHLLSVGTNFSIKQLMDEVVLFFSAGVDTTAVSMGYLFVCLGIFKDIQKKVVEEILDVFGESDRPMCLEDLPKLQYLDRVIKETMRMFPSVPFVARSAEEDIDIEDYIIPKGASIIAAILATHRNEKLWPDPLKFDPDRFLSSEVAKRHPYSYLPFSGGPRDCIGKRYAIMSMKIMAASILRKYEIDTNIKLEDIQSNVQIVARIIGGSKISIKQRHKT